MDNNIKLIKTLINHQNYKNLELNEVVGLIRKLKWGSKNETQDILEIVISFIHNKKQNDDHAINKKITNMLKTKHVPKDIWNDIWFLKIKDFRNFKSILCILIELENKVAQKKQLEYIRIIKESSWLTIHNSWKSYLYDLTTFDKQYKIRKYDECIVFDIEFDMQNGREQIIEISALKIKNNKIVGTFSKLAKNNFKLAPKFMEITGIRPWDIKYKPSDRVVISEFLNFIKNCDVLVGFAIKHNDIPMLKRFDITKRINNFDIGKFKILDLQQYLASSKHEQKSLQYYCEKLNIDVDINTLHRAEVDCIVMYEILLHLDFREIIITKTEL